MGRSEKKKYYYKNRFNTKVGVLYWFYSIVQGAIGIILLIPPIISSFLFICEIYDLGGSISSLMRLSQHWSAIESGTSAAPIYLGLMAIAGAYMTNSVYKIFNTELFSKDIDEIQIIENGYNNEGMS